MVRRFSIYIKVVCCLIFVACASEDRWTTSIGNLSIRLTDGEGTVTRSLPEISSQMTGQFMLTIRNTDKEKLVFQNILSVFNAEPRMFAAGSYSLQAVYGRNETLALDAPYYLSDVTNVVIRGGEEQALVLPCFVANALASFELTNPEKLNQVLKDYYIEIKVGDKSLQWHPGDTANPYFKAGSEVLFYLKGTWIENGQTYSRKFATIQPAVARKLYRYRLAIDTSHMTGAIFDILLDASVETVTLNETVPPEWLPKPTLTSVDFGESNLLVHTETADASSAVISYASARPVQDIEFELNFSDPNLSVLNKKYLLTSLSPADRTALQTSGISIPVLDGTSLSGNIDFTSATANLLTKNGGQEVINEIKLKVRANNRWSDEKHFVIKTVKPTFRVKVYPGDVWTREFAKQALSAADVDPPANFVRFGTVMYEFSEDGLHWSLWEGDTKKQELNPGQTYYVRAKYRGEVTSQTTTVRTYEQVAVPNSDLNGGYDTSYPKKDNPLYSFKGGWIGTRNSLTCHTSGVNAFYVSKSSTLPVSENGSTVAHMMTLGWGSGNTCNVGNKSGSVINHVSAGMLCVGDYDVSKDSVAPKAVYARPTSLSFVYKAAPYNGDEYLIEAYVGNLTAGKYTVVGKAVLKSGAAYGSYQTQTIPFVYDEKQRDFPISHMKILFKSGTKEDTDHLENKFRDASLWNGYTNAYLIGSQFWLDSFMLHYDK